MKPSPATLVGAALALCAILVLGAMSWLTRSVLAAERERSGAEARADLQERMRLALWRMDSAGAAFIVEQTQLLELAADQPAQPLVKMRFETGRGGALTSARPHELAPELAELLESSPATRALLLGIGNDVDPSNWGPAVAENSKAVEGQGVGRKATQELQVQANVQEYANRDRAVENVIQKTQTFNPPVQPGPRWFEAGLPRPAWIADELFMFRRIVRVSGTSVQGLWLDGAGVKAMLLDEARDLLPLATLVPELQQGEDDGMVLASFPWRLVNPAAAEDSPPGTATVVSLAVGWTAVLLALLAGALLVRGVMRLSERRASFVSAVTHELRTPLTTFKLYADLLENDVVREDQRHAYLHVLGREADRLSHLVENVLAFSRVERGSAKAVVRRTSAADLLEPLGERLERHLGDAGMQLHLDLGGEAARLPLTVDAAAVEHILFNLIDNAAKYAAGGDPPVVSIAVKMARGGVAVSVSDHGPGVSAAEQQRIFRAFHKSARDAAESRPGVGLGLALSRRLARGLGGDLVYQPGTGGGCFVLTLPRER